MTAGELIALAAACGSVAAVCITCLVMVAKIGRMAGSMETTLGAQNIAISGLREEIKELKTVVTKQAIQDTRLDNMGSLMVRIQTQVDELAHGEGFVFPLEPTLRQRFRGAAQT